VLRHRYTPPSLSDSRTVPTFVIIEDIPEEEE
jgi:hypothetical protein